MILTYRFRLKDKHAAELNRQAEAVNVVWNYCNEMQQKAARLGRPWLTATHLQRLTSGSTKLLGVPAQTICRVCIQYANSRGQQKKPWLKFRGRQSLGWLPFHAQDLRLFKGGVRLCRHEFEAMHWRGFPRDATLRNGSFNADSRGRWFVNVTLEAPDTANPPVAQVVGIDLGLRDLVTLSDGRKASSPRLFRKSEAGLATAQRARKSRRMRNIHTKAANRRRDFLHKLSAKISEEFGLIVIGDVSSSKLAQTRMAKSVFDAGWYSFKEMLSYKSVRNGGRMIEVNEHNTSQACSTCGALPEGRPKGIAGLGIREWTCGSCGTVHDRDVNAARNILARGLASLAEGAAKERSSQLSLEGLSLTYPLPACNLHSSSSIVQR